MKRTKRGSPHSPPCSLSHASTCCQVTSFMAATHMLFSMYTYIKQPHHMHTCPHENSHYRGSKALPVMHMSTHYRHLSRGAYCCVHAPLDPYHPLSHRLLCPSASTLHQPRPLNTGPPDRGTTQRDILFHKRGREWLRTIVEHLG